MFKVEIAEHDGEHRGLIKQDVFPVICCKVYDMSDRLAGSFSSCRTFGTLKLAQMYSVFFVPSFNLFFALG